MAAIDDIMGGSTFRSPIIKTAPPPIDASISGSSLSVGSEPVKAGDTSNATAPKIQSIAPRVQISGIDATKHVGKPEVDAVQLDENPDQKTRRLSYVEMYEMMNPNKPETLEEKSKREKRERAEATLATVSDSISALANLFFTSQYAPNSYDGRRGMSAATKERWDRLRQEREANRKIYNDSYLRAMAMDEAKEKDDRNWRHVIEREKIADERYEIKVAQDKALADLNEKLKQHQITAAEHKAEQERIKAQFAEENERLEQAYRKAGINQRRAAANASYASANASNARADHYRNGGRAGKGPTLQLEEDEPMRFDDDKDYDRTVMRLAPDYGVPTTTVEVTERDRKGQPKKQRTVKRDVKDIAADIEREAAKRKKQKSDNTTMPGVGRNGGGSSTTMPGVK